MSKELLKLGLSAVALVLVFPLAILAQEQETTIREELEELKRGQETIQRQIEIMREIEALKKGQEEIRKQLEEVMKLLQNRPAPRAAAGSNVQNVLFDLGENPVKGDSTAALTLVEFTDYQ